MLAGNSFTFTSLIIKSYILVKIMFTFLNNKDDFVYKLLYFCIVNHDQKIFMLCRRQGCQYQAYHSSYLSWIQ